MKPKVLVLSGYGINCEKESKFAFELEGADADIVHVNDLISKDKLLDDYQILVFPGGFSYGDDTGSGNAFANKIRLNLWEDLKKFIDSGKLIIGICNGFQVLVNLGLLPSLESNYGKRDAALISNNSNTYECRWVYLKNNSSKCVFTKNIDKMYVPVAHGEGKFFAEDNILSELEKNDQVVFKYILPNGSASNGEFPFNPNGSLNDIAGICDESGRILGMMPHPERAIFTGNFPTFHKFKEELKRQGKEIPTYYGPTRAIFRNAVDYVKENLVNSKEELTYAQAGVDIDENNLANSIVKKIIPITFNDKVIVGLEGLFSAGYRLDRTQGNYIGQKLFSFHSEGELENKLSKILGDIRSDGGTPLFLTDYIASGKMKAIDSIIWVLKIINSMRKVNGSFLPLVGGEFAEMPGVIKPDGFEIVVAVTYQTNSPKEGLVNLREVSGDIITTSIDSVGTKTKLGLQLNSLNNLFLDMVGHSVGDICVQSSQPLGVAMYVGNSPNLNYPLREIYTDSVKSSNLVDMDFLVEPKEIYLDNQFDIVGSIIGVIDEKNLLTGKNIEEGDYLIGKKCFGVNTNGFSLIRKLGDNGKLNYSEILPGTNLTVGAALLEAHENYNQTMKEAKRLFGTSLKGAAHITGGGIEENTERLLPKEKKLKALILSLPDNPVFNYLQSRGDLNEEEMNKTFNRGVGVVFVVDKNFSGQLSEEKYHLLGKVVKAED